MCTVAVVVTKTMPDRQCHRMDIPAHAGTAHNAVAQKEKKKKTGRGSLINRPSCVLDDPVGEGTELN